MPLRKTQPGLAFWSGKRPEAVEEAKMAWLNVSPEQEIYTNPSFCQGHFSETGIPFWLVALRVSILAGSGRRIPDYECWGDFAVQFVLIRSESAGHEILHHFTPNRSLFFQILMDRR